MTTPSKEAFLNYCCHHMASAPNRKQVDPKHSNHNTTKAILDFFQKTRFNTGAMELLQQRTDNSSNHQKKMANITKGQWSAKEDKALFQLVKCFGKQTWSLIATVLNERISKHCRDRWHYHIKPKIMGMRQFRNGNVPYGGGYVPVMVNVVENNPMDNGLAMEMELDLNKEIDVMELAQ
ncbi:hypothetical protein VNO78_16221 [Psophocarpus tetragonolobus]|uniref:Myb-like DNA-binding domain containing protein n=1 Tax=Psophocarpus tetragonolobus TaxID=3891 RepID=A0AAN9SFW9_PSOTE